MNVHTMQYHFNKSHIKLVAIFLPIGVGIGMVIHDCLEYQEGLSSANWVAAEGKILNHQVKSERMPGWGKMIFIPTVVYSYHIKDEAYRGKRMSFPDNIPAPEKNLKKLLESIEVGHPVTAYYDPNNIARVTLFRGARHSKYLPLFLRDAAVIVASPLIYALFFLRRRKRA